jgi:hypothetical protein
MRQRMALTSLPVPIDESCMSGSTCKTTNYVYNLKYQVQNITQCGLEFLLFCYFLTGTLPTAAPVILYSPDYTEYVDYSITDHTDHTGASSSSQLPFSI